MPSPTSPAPAHEEDDDSELQSLDAAGLAELGRWVDERKAELEDFITTYPTDPHLFRELPEELVVAEELVEDYHGFLPYVPPEIFRPTLRSLESLVERLVLLEAAGPPSLISIAPPIVRTAAGCAAYSISMEELEDKVARGWKDQQIADWLDESTATVQRRLRATGPSALSHKSHQGDYGREVG